MCFGTFIATHLLKKIYGTDAQAFTFSSHDHLLVGLCSDTLAYTVLASSAEAALLFVRQRLHASF